MTEKNSLECTATQSDRTQETQKSGKIRFWQSIEKMEQMIFNINENMGQTLICFK